MEEGIQKIRDEVKEGIGREGFRTGGIHERRDSGLKEFRTRGI